MQGFIILAIIGTKKLIVTQAGAIKIVVLHVNFL